MEEEVVCVGRRRREVRACLRGECDDDGDDTDVSTMEASLDSLDLPR